MTFMALAFICAVTTPPQDCDRSTAVAVIQLPEGCARGGQGTVADSAIRPGEGFYLLVKCEGR